MHLCYQTFNFYDVLYMFRTKGSSLGTWWTYRYGTICLHANGISRLLIPYNRLPEDEPSGSKHVEIIVKIKVLVSQS